MGRQKVLIVGAGIAGPTLAYWLSKGGWRPTLVERAPEPRTGGYVIDFWGLGYEIARRMGLGDQLDAHGYDVQELRFLDTRGRRIGRLGSKVFEDLAGGRYTSLPRSDLSRMIHGLIEGRCETRFGDSVGSLIIDDDCVNVRFDSGIRDRFDLVIGADGLHSAVRARVFGPESQFERYLGYVVVAFQVEGYPNRDKNIYVSYGLPGKQIARLSLGEGKTLFLLVFAASEPPRDALRDRAAQEAFVRQKLAGAGWECPQIIAAMEESDDLYFDLVSQMRLPRWTHGRVGLVGDAAFAPSLLAGQGAALAMIGAYVLAGELTSSPDQPEAALRRYEEELHGFMVEKQRWALEFARSFAPRTRLGLWLRNQMTRALSAPGVARLMLGAGLTDYIQLPDFPALEG